MDGGGGDGVERMRIEGTEGARSGNERKMRKNGEGEAERGERVGGSSGRKGERVAREF